MDIIKFVPEQLLILVAGIYVIGIFLKSTPKVKDWLIPWVLLLIGVIGSVTLQQGFTALAVFQGIAATGVAVLTNQLIKQTIIKAT
ncbi:phage holin family protein [Clostridium sp. YIM B02505]|uniref:Phage holin family protein n=1 Tax=Clostridium yunnanense TaxID=2800325 RepID=A0ABS1EJ89_9CLOT|nr:phage holin family protein [Clostridium yunnanense]MBK1809422.1 phage holin family protein [Clostridium yunnanense]